MAEENKDPEAKFVVDDFYNKIQQEFILLNKTINTKYITSRTTEQNILEIETVCTKIRSICDEFHIQTKDRCLLKDDLCIKVFKYFICNTNFTCQSLLTNDPINGSLVDIKPLFSPYLFIEILWSINFESILAESMLHLPLDLCIEIIEVLPRCLDILDFERALKFLITIIPNIYKKFMILKDTGSQSKDIVSNMIILAANLQELTCLFFNERFLKFSEISKSDSYKRHGILLKKIIYMVRNCLNSKSEKLESICELEKMYKMRFDGENQEKIEDSLFEEVISEMDRKLVNLLLKKVKEIDCNIYLDWIEYNDEDNTSLTLQRAVGLESYFFIEKTKDLKNLNIQEYNHLVECLKQISSAPIPENNIETLKLTELNQGVMDGIKTCLLSLFHRYREWDDLTAEFVNDHISLLDKESLEKLFEFLVEQLADPLDQSEREKLQLYILCLGQALANLEIKDLFEMTTKFILRFSEKDRFDNIDTMSIENFLLHNSNFSSPKHIRVVLFFLCIKPKPTLKILLKMTIGHSDYPDVAVSIDDLMLLTPVLQIQIRSTCESITEVLINKFLEKEKCKIVDYKEASQSNANESKTVALIVGVLQDIFLEPPRWSAKKFSALLKSLYPICKVSPIVNEVFTPFLMAEACTYMYLNYILVELHKLIGKFDEETNQTLIQGLEMQTIRLLKSNHISRYQTDELLTLISDLSEHLLDKLGHFKFHKHIDSNYLYLFHNVPISTYVMGLEDTVTLYMNLHERRLSDYRQYKHLSEEEVIRYLLLKCTRKQYADYGNEIINSFGEKLKWTSRLDACDNMIRITLESCLLCLEYPEVGLADSVSFLLCCLILFLSSQKVSTNKKEFYGELSNSLRKHMQILKPIVETTVISEAYSELMSKWQESTSNLATDLKALKCFADSCSEKNEVLKTFAGPHSPLGIKVWLAYDIVNAVVDGEATNGEHILKLRTYFK